MKTKQLFTLLTVSTFTLSAQAELGTSGPFTQPVTTTQAESAPTPLYGGFGLGFNSLGYDFSDDATGFQFFGGYKLDSQALKPMALAVEFGYMDSGDFDDLGSSDSLSGLWGGGVASYFLRDGWSLLGRAGIDIGDDDGIMMGFGVDYQLNPKMGLRSEYVLRDNVDSFQFNVRVDF